MRGVTRTPTFVPISAERNSAGRNSSARSWLSEPNAVEPAARTRSRTQRGCWASSLPITRRSQTSARTTACWALRPGRYAYCSGGRSASKIGSSTSIIAAVMQTRSRKVEMPNGLSLPLAFGMYTLLIGSGRYVSCLSARAGSPSHRCIPYTSMSAKSCPSTPGAPLLERH